MHRITPNRTGTLNSQQYPVYTKDLPLRPKFWSVSLYDYSFPRYRVIKNQKCTEWPQIEIEHLSQKYTIYSKSSGAQIMVCLALQQAVSEIQGRQKSEMHWMTPNWTGTLNSQKYPVYTKDLPPRPKFWSAFFKIYGRRKSELHWMTPIWTWEHLTVKSTLCTLNTYPWGPNFGQFHYDLPFLR